MRSFGITGELSLESQLCDCEAASSVTPSEGHAGAGARRVTPMIHVSWVERPQSDFGATVSAGKSRTIHQRKAMIAELMLAPQTQ